MNTIRKAKILKALDLDFYLPRYSYVDIYPIIMRPKILAISSLACEKKEEERMLKGMLDVLDVPSNCISIARRKSTAEDSKCFSDEIKNIIEQVSPQKILYFGSKDNNERQSNWIFIAHPRYIIDDHGQKKAAYMKLLDLKKEL